MQVSSLILNLTTRSEDFYPLVAGLFICTFSTPQRVYSPAAISTHWTYGTHCHLCPSRYSFIPERGETWYFSRNPLTSSVWNRMGRQRPWHHISLTNTHLLYKCTHYWVFCYLFEFLEFQIDTTVSRRAGGETLKHQFICLILCIRSLLQIVTVTVSTTWNKQHQS